MNHLAPTWRKSRNGHQLSSGAFLAISLLIFLLTSPFLNVSTPLSPHSTFWQRWRYINIWCICVEHVHCCLVSSIFSLSSLSGQTMEPPSARCTSPLLVKVHASDRECERGGSLVWALKVSGKDTDRKADPGVQC